MRAIAAAIGLAALGSAPGGHDLTLPRIRVRDRTTIRARAGSCMSDFGTKAL